MNIAVDRPVRRNIEQPDVGVHRHRIDLWLDQLTGKNRFDFRGDEQVPGRRSGPEERLLAEPVTSDE